MLLSQIRELGRTIGTLDAQRDEYMGQRDKLIIKALQEKVPVTEIVSASGVNRPRIYQIRELHKEDKS